MIFVELLIVDVNRLEIVIERLQAPSRRDRGGWAASQDIPLKRSTFGAINIGNDKKENTAAVYIIDF